jgi:beta-1,4-mannosyltransferase
MGTRVLAWPAFKPDTGNPYTALLSGALERRGALVDEFSPGRLLRGRYDVWHLHWPERLANEGHPLRRVLAFAALVAVARARRVRVVWTVHNVEGHGRARRPRLERGLMRFLSRRLDGIVALSGAGAGEARRRYPALDRAPVVVVPHGHYVGSYPNAVSPTDSRTLLGLSAGDRVVAFVGRIRPDKGVERLIHEFRGLDDAGARLVVAGRPATAELGLAVETAAAGDGRIQLHLDEVADEELQVFLNAADLVVLPYERLLESGIALLALSFGRPVLVPASPTMRDLGAQVESDNDSHDPVRLFEGPLTARDLADALAAPAVDREALIARVRRVHDWDAIAERTLMLYAEAAR